MKSADLVPSLPFQVLAGEDLPRNVSLSRACRQRVIQRCAVALYRWYVNRSQQNRNWNPDTSFDWRSLRRDHDPRMIRILEGFYAVEQYVPDYTAELTRLMRESYGRSHFQLRWGAEEAKHSDLWRNALLCSLARNEEELDEYTADLRSSAWEAPFDTPIQMLFYTVLQERAAQLIYLRTGALARGETALDPQSNSRDPVLAKALAAIATDEAAHYDFFLSLARLHLYYFPQESLEALVTVLQHFEMPAARIVPNYDAFVRVVYDANIFGPMLFGAAVAKPALAALGIHAVRELERSILEARRAPTPDGGSRPEEFPGCDFGVLESSVRALFDRMERYGEAIGMNDVEPQVFVRNTW